MRIAFKSLLEHSTTFSFWFEGLTIFSPSLNKGTFWELVTCSVAKRFNGEAERFPYINKFFKCK